MDCMEGMKSLKDNSVDLVLTDPPYKLVQGGVTGKLSKKITGVTLNHESKETKKGNGGFSRNEIKFSEWLPEVFRVLKESSHFYVMVNDRNTKEMLVEAEKVGFKLLNILVWQKNNAMPNHFYMKNAEFILFFRKGGAKYINDQSSKVILNFDNPKNKIHPTQKPVGLMKTLIENSSNEGDIILDPFMGSCTTAIACIKTNRKYLGYEIGDKEYINGIKNIGKIDKKFLNELPEEEKPAQQQLF